jgi:aquaporin PIP
MGFHKTVSGRAPEKKETDDLYEHRHPFSGYKWLETPREYRTLVKATAMEFVGTAVFIFLAIGSVTSGCQTKDVKAASGNAGDTSVAEVVPGSCFLQSTTLLNIALSFGLSLFIVIYFTASFSGGHINPAVSLAMFITKRISLLRCVIYTIFQCAGAAVASIVLKGLNPVGYKAAAGAANQLNAEAGATIGVALGYEIILTFVLVFVVFAATDTKRALMTAPLPVLAPLSIGITVFAIHLVGVPIDGCCVNPARGFGAAAVARVWSDYWIFWVGPFVGAIIAAVLYEAAFKTRRIDRSESDKQQEADVETGIPVASNTSAAVHSGVAGLAE